MDVSRKAPDTSSERRFDGADVVYQKQESQTGEREEDDTEEEDENETLQATADLSRQPHQIRVIVHNNHSDSSDNVLVTWMTELQCGVSIEEVRKGRVCKFAHNYRRSQKGIHTFPPHISPGHLPGHFPGHFPHPVDQL